MYLSGPSLPQNISGQGMVSLGNRIFSIGGTIDRKGIPINDIYQFECHNFQCTWLKLSQSLQYGRFYFVAMLIPDDLAECSQINKTEE